MLMKLIERLTGRTRRTSIARHFAAKVPAEQRAARIEAQVHADIERRELAIRATWEEVRAIAGRAPSAHDTKGTNTKP